jgi:hypothetical protein
MWHRYGYFVRKPNGGIAPAGHDFNQSPTAYKLGDRKTRGNVQAYVIGVLTGAAAEMTGNHVYVLLEERTGRPAEAGPPPVWDFFETDEGKDHIEKLLHPPRLVARPQIQANALGSKFRAVGKSVYQRPEKETFYDFEIHHLLWTLGKDWFDAEMKKPLGERHVILRWRTERNEQLKKHQDPEKPADHPVSVPSTGRMRALQVLADDVYHLAHSGGIPKRIIERLRDGTQFQGARNEILTASLLAKCGFTIRFIDDTSKRNPEFFAERGNERIAVEAKSRHRRGVLHERGDFNQDAPAKIRELYENAAGQNPGDCPFLIFIDVNLPLTPNVEPLKRTWVVEAMKAFGDRQSEELQNRDTALILTNYGWHFYRDEYSPPGETCFALAPNAPHPIDRESWRLLLRAMSEYGVVTDDGK